jgi:glycosyltransferase involved in cell wall biosynthesis
MFFLSKGSLEACRPDVAGTVPEQLWRVLYNGLDMDRFRPDAVLREQFRTEHSLQQSVAIGVACALRPRKQLEHLFRAAAAVDAKNVRIVVAGSAVAGDEDYASQLLSHAKSLLGDRLILLGHVRDLRAFYNGLDLFVNTSQEEACSISVIESLASGLPILGYPSTSVDEQVLPTGGEIVPQDSIAELSSALRRWIADPVALHDARRSARQRAESTFDIRTLANQLWSEYEGVLADRGLR